MEWRVPLADIDIGDEEIAAVEQVLRSRWLTMGEATQRFEQAFASFVGSRHALAVANGTVALHLAFAALDLGPGDDVILPALTMVATANAVLYTGATPVFADIGSLDDLTVSADDIECKITPRTRAICVMHYAGYPCAMDRISEIARRHKLAVVEDAAHAPGAAYGDRKCGTIGDVGCFSFFSNKNLAVGEGGMVVTDNDELAEQMRLMRSHGMTTLTWDRHKGHAHSYDVVRLGYNYRLDEMRAAIGLVQLHKVDANNARRRVWTERYRQALALTHGVTVPFSHPHGQPSYHIMPVVLDEGVDRAAFIASMKARGIQTSMHYPPVHTFSYYRQAFGDRDGTLPLTEEIGTREVTLPLFPTMTDGDFALVVDAVKKSLREPAHDSGRSAEARS